MQKIISISVLLYISLQIIISCGSHASSFTVLLCYLMSCMLLLCRLSCPGEVSPTLGCRVGKHLCMNKKSWLVSKCMLYISKLIIFIYARYIKQYYQIDDLSHHPFVLITVHIQYSTKLSK